LAGWSHIHFVGIGGSGLSAVARLMLERGVTVSGSDLTMSAVARALVSDGVRVFSGHRTEQIAGADVVVVSSAVPDSNVEVQAARAAGIPVLRRPQFLSEITAGHKLVAVAGTHGKTTTSALIAAILMHAGSDPTFVIGGVIAGWATNARAGNGEIFVIEADEYDRTFLSLAPTVGVVLNVEHDHPDCYPSFDDVRQAFVQFVDAVPHDGLLVVCADNPAAAGIGAQRRSRGGNVVFYGLSTDAEWRAEDVRLNNAGGTDFLAVQGDEVRGLVRTRLTGLHNVSNVVAALAVTNWLGVPFRDGRAAVTEFRGVRRRFEMKGSASGVVIIDDYAHHPTEIQVTLDAVRTRFPGHKVWAVWQPHTYSRVKALSTEFLHSFGNADHVMVLPVYAARESDTLGITSESLVSEFCGVDASFSPSPEAAATTLAQQVRPGDVVITLGAGDGFIAGERLLQTLEEEADELNHTDNNSAPTRLAEELRGIKRRKRAATLLWSNAVGKGRRDQKF